MDYSKSWKQTRMTVTAWGTYFKHYHCIINYMTTQDFIFQTSVSIFCKAYLVYVDFIYISCIALFFLCHQNLCTLQLNWNHRKKSQARKVYLIFPKFLCAYRIDEDTDRGGSLIIISKIWSPSMSQLEIRWWPTTHERSKESERSNTSKEGNLANKQLEGYGIPVVMGGENAVNVGADLTGRLENLLRFHRVNGRRLLGALVHDSWNRRNKLQSRNQCFETNHWKNRANKTSDAGWFVQVGIVVLQARDRNDLHLRIPRGCVPLRQISGLEPPTEKTGSREQQVNGRMGTEGFKKGRKGTKTTDRFAGVSGRVASSVTVLRPPHQSSVYSLYFLDYSNSNRHFLLPKNTLQQSI